MSPPTCWRGRTSSAEAATRTISADEPETISAMVVMTDIGVVVRDVRLPRHPDERELFSDVWTAATCANFSFRSSLCHCR